MSLKDHKSQSQYTKTVIFVYKITKFQSAIFNEHLQHPRHCARDRAKNQTDIILIIRKSYFEIIEIVLKKRNEVLQAVWQEKLIQSGMSPFR